MKRDMPGETTIQVFIVVRQGRDDWGSGSFHEGQAQDASQIFAV